MTRQVKDVDKSIEVQLQGIDDVLPEHAKILYVRPSDSEFLRHLIVQKDIDLTVMDHDIKRIELYTQQSMRAYRGYCEQDLRRFGNKEFEYIVLDRILQSSTVPEKVLCDAVYAAKYVIVTIMNYGHISRRISFAFTGKFFQKNESKWYNQEVIKPCSLTEFVQLCWDSKLVIERAFCYDKKGASFSLYDIRKMPNLLADSAVFVISNDSTLIDTPIT
jgi:methionine biosynthesis protein MetW